MPSIAPRWLVATIPAVLLTILAAPLPAQPGAAAPSLPDSVLATVGTQPVTAGEFVRQWRRLPAESRPAGVPTTADKRAFLDELINKEVLTQATEGARRPLAAQDSARLAALRVALVRQVFFQAMVLDSLPPAGAPAASQAERVAARERTLIERMTAPLAPRFDDSTAALLARAFSKLPAPMEQGAGWMRMQSAAWPPPVLPADTARVLITSNQGRFTVGDYLRYWNRVAPMQRDRPDSAAAVIDWARSFLAQDLIDAEGLRRGYDRNPQVQAQLAARRQVMAVEDYYRNVVLARVDTSDAHLEAVWKQDPARYRMKPHDRYHALWYATEAEARAAAAALTAGAGWDSLLDARYAAPGDPQLGQVRQREAEPFRLPQAISATSQDTLLVSWLRGARPGQVFGPRERVGQWWVYRFLDHRDGSQDTFADARPLVLQQVLAEEGESTLRAHLEQLRGQYGVSVNDAALAALAVPAASGEGPDLRRAPPPRSTPRAAAPARRQPRRSGRK